ncbi:hypothetical protein [Labrenzia sp. OB1]|uniref:hypothetical protein n=1 Tax=Labrenzia sp. OB1 TaxID=1561204 RepID=UPI0007B26E84|nr:hypothetical protein [Labrenzia sp. OB1]KZM51663.1 hypothetical protein OA90_04420 [Labrenzia sp. OB1]
MITVPLVWLVSVLTTFAAFALVQETRLKGAARVQPFLVVMVAPWPIPALPRSSRTAGRTGAGRCLSTARRWCSCNGSLRSLERRLLPGLHS